MFITCPSCHSTSPQCEDCDSRGFFYVPRTVGAYIKKLEAQVAENNLVHEVEKKLEGGLSVNQKVRTTREAVDDGLTTIIRSFNERIWGATGRILEAELVNGTRIYRVRHDPHPNSPIYGWYIAAELEPIQ